MNPIIEILMDRDELSYDEALEIFEEAKVEADNIINENNDDAISSLIELEDILSNYFGLEPDYIFDLVDL